MSLYDYAFSREGLQFGPTEEERVFLEIMEDLWDEVPEINDWTDFMAKIHAVEVSTDPADDDTDYDPWIDRPFTAKELEAIQSAGDSDVEW